MSVDQLPPDFAPYHLVQTDLPCAAGLGRYYDLQLALADLDGVRRLHPEHVYCLLTDGGVLDDSKIERYPRRPFPDVDYLKTATTAPAPKKPVFKILRKAA